MGGLAPRGEVVQLTCELERLQRQKWGMVGRAQIKELEDIVREWKVKVQRLQRSVKGTLH
jgi:hypothetical protein